MLIQFVPTFPVVSKREHGYFVYLLFSLIWRVLVVWIPLDKYYSVWDLCRLFIWVSLSLAFVSPKKQSQVYLLFLLVSCALRQSSQTDIPCLSTALWSLNTSAGILIVRYPCTQFFFGMHRWTISSGHGYYSLIINKTFFYKCNFVVIMEERKAKERTKQKNMCLWYTCFLQVAGIRWHCS